MPIGLSMPTKSVKEGVSKSSTSFSGLNEPYGKEVRKTVPAPEKSDSEKYGPLFNVASTSSGFPLVDGAEPLAISSTDGGPGDVGQERGVGERTTEEAAPLLFPARRSEQPGKRGEDSASDVNQEVAIHLAAEQPPDSIDERRRPLTGHHSSTTCFNFCGPNKAKILQVLTLVLCIWCIVITGWHLSKKVMGLQSEVADLNNEVEALWGLMLENEDFDGRQMARLRNEIHRMIHKVLADLEGSQGKVVNSRRGKTSPSTEGARMEKSVPKRRPSNGNDLSGIECVSEGGKPCIFPFYHKGVKIRECTKAWTDLKAWCAVKVDKDGALVQYDSSAWDYCSLNCTSM